MKTIITVILSLITSSLWAQVIPNASKETKALLQELTQISLQYKTNQKILIGQQNAFTEGRGWRHFNRHLGTPLRSDMYDVAGVHPAIFGIDFDEIGSWNRDFIIERINLVAEQGGIATLSWHMKNPLNGRSSSHFTVQRSSAVQAILPGGTHHSFYVQELDRLVDFMKEVSSVPIIFRPFHEHNGSWFWWGQRHTTTRDFVTLWRFTIDYLVNKGVNNFLVAYSPANITKSYFERYPGDNYVDILGVDTYFRNRVSDMVEHNPASAQLKWKRDVIWLMKEASKRNKIPAITEFGQEAVRYENFWSDYMSWPVEKAGILQLIDEKDLPKYGIAFVMLWRNDPTDKKHFYGPIYGNHNNQNFLDLLRKNIWVGLAQ
jgi:mannan endo-1,4-beta-mannosidase